jgi:hypothetical protein
MHTVLFKSQSLKQANLVTKASGYALVGLPPPGATKFSTMTHCIMTLSIMGLFATLSINGTQPKWHSAYMALSINGTQHK